MAALQIPGDPTLGPIAEVLETHRCVAEIWDARWRLAYLTSDYVLSAGIADPATDGGIGEPIYGAATIAIRERWPGGGTTESLIAHLRRMLPGIAADLPGGIEELRAGAAPELQPLLGDLQPERRPSMTLELGEIRFGRRTTGYLSIITRILDGAGAFAGTATVVLPALSGSTLSLLGTGDHRSLEQLIAITRPARRPGAILFTDLEASTPLARRLPTPAYFQLVRRLVTCIDDEIVARGGIVGKHVGDGATAFFLAAGPDGESATARACIEAARAIRARADDIAQRSDLAAGDVVLRFGLHWGATLYVGRLLTSGRAEVTALGDEVNEGARIEACATGGRALASKALMERLSGGDAAALGIATEALRFTALGDLATATEKARRDAPVIAVCEV